MYAPPVFREDSVDVMQDLMRTHPFATLIMVEDERPNANHIPFALHTEDGSKFGILRGHVARPNPLWSEFDTAIEVLVVFQGPNHYVTPS